MILYIFSVFVKMGTVEGCHCFRTIQDQGLWKGCWSHFSYYPCLLSPPLQRGWEGQRIHQRSCEGLCHTRTSSKWGKRCHLHTVTNCRQGQGEKQEGKDLQQEQKCHCTPWSQQWVANMRSWNSDTGWRLQEAFTAPLQQVRLLFLCFAYNVKLYSTS